MTSNKLSYNSSFENKKPIANKLIVFISVKTLTSLYILLFYTILYL